VRPSSSAITLEEAATRREWPAVYVSRASTVADSASRAAVERSITARCASSSDAFWSAMVSLASSRRSTVRCVKWTKKSGASERAARGRLRLQKTASGTARSARTTSIVTSSASNKPLSRGVRPRPR